MKETDEETITVTKDMMTEEEAKTGKTETERVAQTEVTETEIEVTVEMDTIEEMIDDLRMSILCIRKIQKFMMML